MSPGKYQGSYDQRRQKSRHEKVIISLHHWVSTTPSWISKSNSFSTRNQACYNSFNSFLVGNVFLWPLFLNDILAGYNNPGLHFLSIRILNIFLHCLLELYIVAKDSKVHLFQYSLSMTYFSTWTGEAFFLCP